MSTISPLQREGAWEGAEHMRKMTVGRMRKQLAESLNKQETEHEIRQW